MFKITSKKRIIMQDMIPRIKKTEKKISKKMMLSTVLSLVLIFSVIFQMVAFSAFEAHIINVIAHICGYSEMRTMGYWKNHPNIYMHYLPQYLDNETIESHQEVQDVFDADNSIMRNKLMKQLLAMKFNIAHFGIGEYLVESEGKTLNEIVAEADDLLIEDPEPPKEVLEEMENLLDYLNNFHQITFCRVDVPDYDYLVINKVYYDVDANHGSEDANEWIEIYNPSDQPKDISSWSIADNTSEDVIPVSSPIPVGGFAIITGDNSTFDFWEVPAGVIKIVLEDGKIGNGLNNDGDRMILKDADGVEVDAMSYGSDTYAFDPSAPDVDEGHALGREPLGFDSNTANDWKDFGPPEINVLWPNGGEVLYVGRTYNLMWEAFNQNGPDSALSIDIYYSRDSGTTWATILQDTENDGVYKWRVPLFINGYYVPSSKARIKMAAVGPENFMMQDWDITDDDFCPPIDFDLLTPEELQQVKELGLWPEMEDVADEIAEEEIIIDGTTTEEVIIDEVVINEESNIEDIEENSKENSEESVIEVMEENELAIEEEIVSESEIIEESTQF